MKAPALSLFSPLALILSAWMLLAACVSAANGQVLHAFSGNEGSVLSPLVRDTNGDLLGTTVDGGQYQSGTVYKLTPSANGPWKLSTIYEFNDSKPIFAGGPLTQDAAGNIYGTTRFGGSAGLGQVYELSPSGNNRWSFKTLFSFIDQSSYYAPSRGVTFDNQGNLFGTTSQKAGLPAGAVYELSPDGNNGWSEQIIHEFRGNMDGKVPSSPLYIDAAGSVYGTTYGGGQYNDGVLYQLQPQQDGSK